MHFLPYNRNLKKFSRDLRFHSTLSEILLWQKLRASQLRGYGFNRQKPLGNFIVDFYCRKLSLVIEIDGDSHFYAESLLEDQKRQNLLEGLELSFLRFSDIDVKKSMPFVLQEIENFIDEWEDKNQVSRTSNQKIPLPPL